MHVPIDLMYSPRDHWVRTLPDGLLEIGITEFAQDALGPLVFLQLPEVGRSYAADEPCALVESAKTSSDVFAPVAGKVVAVNVDAEADPESINAAPYKVWLFRLQPDDVNQVSALLTAAQYLAKTQ